MNSNKTIDLNVDIGEGYGVWAAPNQIWRATLARGGAIDSLDDSPRVEEIMALVSSVNLACGFHAGDPYLICRYIDAAQRAGCRIGAHPSYPDRAGFGLRYMDIAKPELKAIIQYQMAALDGLLRMRGSALSHVKCHGALYNRSGHDKVVAEAVVEAVAEYKDDLPLFGLPDSCVEEVAHRVGVSFVRETFSDRAYHNTGALVDRGRSDAMITMIDEVVAQVKQMAYEGKVTTIEGDDLDVRPDTICFHSDTPGVLGFLKAIHAEFEQANIDIQAVC